MKKATDLDANTLEAFDSIYIDKVKELAKTVKALEDSPFDHNNLLRVIEMFVETESYFVLR
jgi:hypothetical protein